MTFRASSKIVRTSFLASLLIGSLHGFAQTSQPSAEKTPDTFALLNLPLTGADETKIDYDKLPVLSGTHAVISPSDPAWKFQLHNYLIHYDNRFFCMWSRGPGEDQATQYIAWAASPDGTTWSPIKTLVGSPPEGYAYIARDFWVRDGELLALVAYFHAPGAFGVNKELKLQAYVYDKSSETWKLRGVVYDNAINNFAPEMLPTGEWMMTRRDARFNVSMLIGGTKALDDWRAVPVVDIRHGDKFRPDEPISWVNPDKTLVALFRDNGGSSHLFRSTSSENAAHWSAPVLTNFPNATSKLFSLATTDGYRVLISNANPKVARRQMFLSGSEDGVTFTRMALLAIPSPKPATLQYPHAIEYDGNLLIAFSRTKKSIELFKVSLRDIQDLRGAKQ
jgi:hypothetical protein